MILEKNVLRYLDAEDMTDSFGEKEVEEAFSKSLLELRKYCGLSLVALSRKTGIPNQTLSAYENAKRMPSIFQAMKITAYFSLTIEEFVLCGLEPSCDIVELYESRKKN